MLNKEILLKSATPIKISKGKMFVTKEKLFAKGDSIKWN